MRRLVISALSLSITFALAAGCSSTQKGPRESVKPTPANISGAWASACTDPGNGQAFRLMFDLTETTWALDYEAFSDAACAAPSITVHIEGGYELWAASSAVPGGGLRQHARGALYGQPLPHAAPSHGNLRARACKANARAGVPFVVRAAKCCKRTRPSALEEVFRSLPFRRRRCGKRARGATARGRCSRIPARRAKARGAPPLTSLI